MTEKDELLPRNQIFSAPFEQKFFSWYRKFFSISEIEESKVLQWVFGILLFGFYLTFQKWIRSSLVTVESVEANTYACWPYFQNCGDWYFLSALPNGYSQTILYMVAFAALLLIAYLMWRRDWVLASVLLTVLFLWKIVIMFVFTSALTANYDYYHIIFTLILLFSPLKLFFLKLVFVLFYFLSATIKFHEGWVLGTYFSSLKTGLPIFPDSLMPLWTNAVIFMHIVESWFLLSNTRFLQRIAVASFVLFHLYSGVLVEYQYPVTTLPLLLVLFGPLYEKTKVPLVKKSMAGWILVASLFVLQFVQILIPGDEKLTLEGYKYGLYLFDANHQCISRAQILGADDTVLGERNFESPLARNRCNPYSEWFSLQQICKRDERVQRIVWQFDHSINGGPFYRIVDAKDACSLEYNSFSHNTWIRTPESGAEIIGHPVKNFYY